MARLHHRSRCGPGLMGIKMSKVEFDASDYRRTHFKAPKGRGVWAFSPNTTGEWMFSPFMTFTDAKEWAQEQAPEATIFSVGP